MLDALRTWLRERRLARGWSVAEMGRQLHRAAKATGDNTVPSTAILASYVRRWEAGKIGITERYKLHYCAALGLSPTQFGPTACLEQSTRTSDLALKTAARDVADGTRVVALDRRSRANVDGSPGEQGGYLEIREGCEATEAAHAGPETALLGRLVALMAEESLDFGEWADTSNIGDATLEQYAAQVRHFAREYIYAPPYPLLLDVQRLRDRVFAKLQGHQQPGQTRDLYLIASQVCGMLAWMSGDMGYQRAAQSQVWTAWVCAEHAAHDGARAWVRATQSKLAYWDAQYAESALLAEDGLRYAARGSVPLMLTSQMARALARAGRADDAQRALSQARMERERASGEDEVGGAFGLTEAQYHYMAGTAQLWRHDPDEAIYESAQAIELFQTRHPAQPHYGPEALTRIDQANAYLQRGDLGGAEEALRPILDLARDLRLELLIQSLAITRHALTQPTFRDAVVARELQEEIETYVRESIVHDLRS